MFIKNGINIDFERIKQILHDFHELTDLCMSVWDSEGNVVYGYPTALRGFCDKINYELGDNKHCHHCDLVAAFKCNETLAPYFYICHAGAYEVLIPIVLENKVRMYFIFGQCVCAEKEDAERDTVRRYCKLKGIPFSSLEPLFDELPRYSEAYLHSLANIAFMTFQSLWDNRVIEVRKDDILLSIDDFIMENMAADLSVKSICSHFHLSKNTLYMLFRNAYRLTVNEYIALKRLEVAKELLVGTELTVTQIAEKIGKKNYNDFIQSFKRYELVSPTKYRKIHKIN